MSELAVVHLVRRANGRAPLERFLRSYREHAAGIDHELVLLMKGFDSGPEEASYGELAGGLSASSLSVSDEGYDLTAYFHAARELSHGRLCFVNSYSEPLVAGWLERLAQAADGPRVGIVGATGSWASQSSHARFMFGLGGRYAPVYRRLGLTREMISAGEQRAMVAISAAGRVESRDGPGYLRRRMSGALVVARRLAEFPPFPTPNIRTNAFLIERELMLSLRPGRLRDKADAYALECGRQSTTRQIERQGLEARLVGRDGIAYGAADWPASNTFWQSAQENLLIADNQTRAYERCDLDVRRVLSAQAWGERAAPTAPLRAQAAPGLSR